MKTYACRLQPVREAMLLEGPNALEWELIEEHFAYLEEAMKDGLVLMAGRTLTMDETSFGMVVFKAESLEAAHDFMENNPAVQKGMIKHELFPFRVSLLNPSWHGN
jgi:uncharacterized protein YciI